MSTQDDRLQLHLKRLAAPSITLSFSNIERVIGGPLPPTAEQRVEWWTNETNSATRHLQCHAWQDAGYNASPNLDARTVTFRRVESH